MVCPNCNSRIDERLSKVCPNCDYNISELIINEKENKKKISFYLIVNLSTIIVFNISYLLLAGKGLYSPWGDIAYFLYGIVILFITELMVSVWLSIHVKPKIVWVLFPIVLIISYFIFVGLTRAVLHNNAINQFVKNLLF